MDMAEAVRSAGAESVREDPEEAWAKVEIWRYVFGFVEMAAVKCVIELGIPDVLEARGEPVALEDLASATGSDPRLLSRVMRFLINRRIFEARATGYVQTPLSRLLMSHGGGSMAGFVLMESSPVMLAPWQHLGRYLKGEVSSSFTGANSVDVWSYAAVHPEHRDLISLAMACDARIVVPGVIRECLDVFEGVKSVVDVGGADGTSLGVLVKACPWIRGINFDLPHVASTGLKIDNVEHVGGDMFLHVPEADAAFIMWVLHDWGDDECVKILTNCRQAVPSRGGKVIILESVLDKETDYGEDKRKDTGLMLDMCMLAHTDHGKERTLAEWKLVLDRSGFASHTVKPIPGVVQSAIIAYP
uniref:O-methyltransferase n=1 Tax=Kalanchoe fedtschenkoi TaxID=63787 RepID=A0A7N0SZY7_KALFE